MTNKEKIEWLNIALSTIDLDYYKHFDLTKPDKDTDIIYALFEAGKIDWDDAIRLSESLALNQNISQAS